VHPKEWFAILNSGLNGLTAVLLVAGYLSSAAAGGGLMPRCRARPC
jgi:hypothetical protein